MAKPNLNSIKKNALVQPTCTEQNYISGLLILNLSIMNTLCLENYGVSKMETREMETTDGGFIVMLIGGALTAAVVYGAFMKGYDDACAC